MNSSFDMNEVPSVKDLNSSKEQDDLIGQWVAAKQRSMTPHLGLKSARKKAKLTQVEMAAKIGVSRKTYQLYENATLPIPSDKIARVVALFDIDVREVFWGRAFPTDRSLKMNCAELGIQAFRALLSEYDKPYGIRLEHEEIERAVLVYMRQHEVGDELDREDLWQCVRLVTGGKYLPDLDGYYEHEERDGL